MNAINHPDHRNHPANPDFDVTKDLDWNPIKPQLRAPLSGGEIPEESAGLRLEMISKISQGDDVREVIELAHRCDGTFLYLIETTFINSFPRYVIGTCDRKLENVSLLFRCGARWSADAEWHRLRHGANHHLHV
jgi:hypothetical protein